MAPQCLGLGGLAPPICSFGIFASYSDRLIYIEKLVRLIWYIGIKRAIIVDIYPIVHFLRCLPPTHPTKFCEPAIIFR